MENLRLVVLIRNVEAVVMVVMVMMVVMVVMSKLRLLRYGRRRMAIDHQRLVHILPKHSYH